MLCHLEVLVLHLLCHGLKLLPFSLQAEQQRQQLLSSGLGKDGRAVAEGERGRGAKESHKDDPTTVPQPHDRKHTHVYYWRCHAPAG